MIMVKIGKFSFLSYFKKTISIIVLFLMISNAPFSQEIKTVHIFVALCDNIYQGIVPVSKSQGNGDSPKTNLYWGAYYGVKTSFVRNKNWKLVKSYKPKNKKILERCIFKHSSQKIYIIADAYRGRNIEETITDFLKSAAGKKKSKLKIDKNEIGIEGNADLLIYAGHNGLMDFSINISPKNKDKKKRNVVILSCASSMYFKEVLKKANAYPLIWTTGLMAPEAYIILGILNGWTNEEAGKKLRERAAQAYNKYQKCGIRGALHLFKTGW
jgi:hypothetical protein